MMENQKPAIHLPPGNERAHRSGVAECRATAGRPPRKTNANVMGFIVSQPNRLGNFYVCIHI